MMWFKKKEPYIEMRRIDCSVFDNTQKRAENIWYALGFVNDNIGAIPRIAKYLEIYNELDRNKESR